MIICITKYVISFIILISLVNGCLLPTHFKSGEPIPNNLVKLIVPGVTTEPEVLDLLGKPSYVSKDKGKKYLSYTYSEGNAVGVAFYTKNEIRYSECLIITLNDKGVVDHVDFNRK